MQQKTQLATRCAAIAAASAIGSAPVLAREEPLWEAGMGVAGIAFPDYRGSEQTHAYALPAPYLVYRGDFFKSDRHGIRGVFYNSDRVDLNLSVGASLPVDSSENTARAGMEDLKPSIELGPSLVVNLWRTPDQRAKLDLRMPLRGAVTIESDPRYIGLQFFPHLNVDVHDPAGFTGWNLGVLAGPVFTDARYNRYFYSVPAESATAQRPAYEAGGGYAGTQFLVALSKRYPSFWIAAFARYDSLRGAAFESSPLVTSKNYAAGGIAISWVFARSERRVAVNPFGDERP